MVLPPSSNDFRQSQVPAGPGIEREFMLKQEDMSFFTEGALQPLPQGSSPRSAMGSWTSTSGADATITCQQLSYSNSWTVRNSQGHGVGSCETLGRALPEVDNHPFEISGAQLSGVAPTRPCSDTSQLRPESSRLSGCRDPTDWVCNPVPAVFGSEPDSSASPQPVGPYPQHSEEMMLSGLPLPSSPLSTLSSPSVKSSTSGSSLVKSPIENDEMSASLVPEEEGSADPPYSVLIYQALLSARGKKLPLQGIYSWFEKNTDKGKDPNSRGWQNSIRHNLSMNAGFEAVKEEVRGAKKPVNFWRLTDEAVKNGIQSTTRYRKQATCKKNLNLEQLAPLSHQSGARGGKVTKVTARVRYTPHDNLRRERQYCTMLTTTHHLEEEFYFPPGLTTGLPLGVPPIAMPLSYPVEIFNLRHVVGCTDYLPSMSLFSEDAAETDYFAVDVGALQWRGTHSGAARRFWTGTPEAAEDFGFGF